jgi:cytochrome P450
LYNISPFHPLSHIPGPKVAAATWLYEAWFDLILGGRYTNEIKRMHEVYGTIGFPASRCILHNAPFPRSPSLKTRNEPPGPVVRINPEELHFNDMSFVDEIYAGKGRKRDKQVHFVESMAGPVRSSMFATLEHDLHRIRRSAVNKFFSRAQIAKLESNIKGLANELCDKIIRLGMF